MSEPTPHDPPAWAPTAPPAWAPTAPPAWAATAPHPHGTPPAPGAPAPAPLPAWAGDVALGVAWFVLGVLGLRLRGAWSEPLTIMPPLLVVAAMSAAVALFRLAPGVAFALVWLACAGQVILGVNISFAQLGVAVVAYGTARYGSTGVLVASGLSLPAAYLCGALFLYLQPWVATDLVDLAAGNMRGYQPGALGALFLVLTAVTLLIAVPWLVGLVLRSRENLISGRREQADAERLRAIAEEQRAHAVEVSQVREQQARLARDVHDVVGHSLAVIVAQAESAQYLPDEPARLKETLAAIAGVARMSLRDVRRVLATGADDVPAPPPGGLDDLIEGVRASGTVIRDVRSGAPVPLTGELGTVAYRVLQEMLTNAIKHGAPGEPVTVSQVWDDGGLLLEVANRRASPHRGHGGGLEGMDRRVGGVAGTLRVMEDETMFVVRAWLPIAGAAA